MGDSKILTPYADPVRQIQARKDITPMSVRNIYSFYESESSELESKEVGEIDIKTLMMEKYLGLVQKLKDNTFSRNKDEDAYEHVEKVLEITSLFSIPRVLMDTIMLRVFSSTLVGVAKIWMGRVPVGTVNTWDLLKRVFIHTYCPPSRPIPGMITTKALVAIHEMTDHSQKLYDGESSRGLGGSNFGGMIIITNKLNDLGRHVKTQRKSACDSSRA
ncbi:hypothetical protein Tco_0575260 [Tanacetum coccineum]